MQNFLSMKPSQYAQQLSQHFGYSETLFLGQDFVVIGGENRKKVLQEIWSNKNKITVFYPRSEEMLRFVLEKTPVDMVLGIEQIHKKDSLHYLRAGLDQVLCKIAAEKGKTIAFSFSEIINSNSRGRLLGRMAANLALCRKFKVKTLFSNFCTDLKQLRSAQDLQAFQEALENNRNIYK